MISHSLELVIRAELAECSYVATFARLNGVSAVLMGPAG